jgi:hypothetical protein
LLIFEDSYTVRPAHAVERFWCRTAASMAPNPGRGVPGHIRADLVERSKQVDLDGRRVPAPKHSPAWTRGACARGHALDAKFELESEPETGARIALRVRPAEAPVP